jgi:two-component system, cell cycle response regulator CpdR
MNCISVEKVLLVDDDVDNLHMVSNLLEAEGLLVQCAVSGKEALWKLDASTFDLMITDLNMPGMDGFELARKATVIAPQMPVIMFTGDISPDVLSKADKAGIAAVLGKPFPQGKLLKFVREVGVQRERRGQATTAVVKTAGICDSEDS